MQQGMNGCQRDDCESRREAPQETLLALQSQTPSLCNYEEIHSCCLWCLAIKTQQTSTGTEQTPRSDSKMVCELWTSVSRLEKSEGKI